MNNFKDKFNLTLKENIFAAKKQSIQLIYNSAKLEGCNVTFPETQTIIDGVNVGSVSLEDIQKILNLKDAWRYILNSIEEPLNLDYIEKVHSFVARNEALEWGILRNGTISVSGSDYIPPIPVREKVDLQLNKLLNTDATTTAKAIKFFLLGCREQFFWDGNKRTSNLIANKILISKGKGLLTISEKDLLEFSTRLTNFYNTNNYSFIDKFLYINCIKGMERVTKKI